MALPYPIKVYDVRPDGHSSLSVLPRLGQGDFEALRQFYRFQMWYDHGYDRAQPGQRFWAITAFELKAGPAILQPRVLDENGNLITNAGILLFLGWPSADVLHVDADPRYVDHAIGGFTENGQIGWGFGPESHIGPDGGPYTVWASSDPANWSNRRVGSDAVTKLGWWDDHIIPNPIFQVVVKGGTPPTGIEYLVDLDAAGNITKYIAWTSGAPKPGNVGALGLYRDGQIVAHIPWNLMP